MDFSGQRAVAAVVFASASAVAMAVAGEGTPLPNDCPRRLVVAGPCRFVRNPMAISGLAQGAGVALWLGSWLTLAYVAAGAVLWNRGVRPLEERDLRRRFGDEYEAYRAAGKCWVPRLRR